MELGVVLRQDYISLNSFLVYKEINCLSHRKKMIILDFGSTLWKAAIFENGNCSKIYKIPALPLQQQGSQCEHSAEEVLPKLKELLSSSSDSDFAMCTQRSSCLFWNRKTGRTLTPIVSWRDRRAEAWCEERRDMEKDVWLCCGLPLSPHYAGPTAAALLTKYPTLRNEPDAIFGTLDSYLIWLLSDGEYFITDHGMAARTLLYSLGDKDWGGPVLEASGLSKDRLPSLVPTRCDLQFANGRRLVATVTDQGAAVLGSIATDGSEILVNGGTGTFVLYPKHHIENMGNGYLIAPYFVADERREYCLEGTVNASIPQVELYNENLHPQSFCLADHNGIGAPYWLADQPQLFSDIKSEEILAEGMIFRIREIIEDLLEGKEARLILTGGASCKHSWVRGLASCLGHSLFLGEEPDASIFGTAKLARALKESEWKRKEVKPEEKWAYLKDKYGVWKHWLKGSLSI
jgi:glycerol kinase